MRRQADREKMEGRVLEGTSGLCSDDGFTPSPTQPGNGSGGSSCLRSVGRFLPRTFQELRSGQGHRG